MKKKILMALGAAGALSLFMSSAVMAEGQKEIVLPAAEAKVSGYGYDQEGNEADTVYDEKSGVITQVGDTTDVVFQVPEGVEGNYDLYLELGKSPYAAGTTYLGVTVGDGEEHVPCIQIQGCNETYSDINELGLIAVEKDVVLNAGEEIIISYKPGYSMEWQGVVSCALPPMGNMYLYETGTPVAVGYGDDKAVPVDEKEVVDDSDVLSGKTIVWLGSSVTYGDGYSMAEVIDENHSAVNTYKYAISGTMLVNTNDSSYVARMKEIDPDMDVDLFVVQLSTNDATAKQTLGEVSAEAEQKDFDDTTIVGAMETIIAYAKETWNCPVVFYTGTYYESEEYQLMVDKLYELKDKWGISIVDLWNNEKLKEMCLSGETNKYMKTKFGTENEPDPIHPNADGYKELWTPVFEEVFKEVLSQ